MHTPIKTPAAAKPPALTLEQRRAQDAWRHVQAGCRKDYVNVAKALPGLIMGSGLLQTLAFAEQKKGEHRDVADQLRDWLCRQVPDLKGHSAFPSFMAKAMTLGSAQQRQLTTESLAWLKWLRQLAAAQEKQKD